MASIRLSALGLIVGLAIAFGVLGCGKQQKWQVGWNIWSRHAAVSKDGRYLYIALDKHISPLDGAWGRRWISPTLRGRVDLITGQIDTGPIRAGMKLVGGIDIEVSDIAFSNMVRDTSLEWIFFTPSMRYHRYGDGRYIAFTYQMSGDSPRQITVLLDNHGSHAVVGYGFSEGWISTDERSVILVRQDSGDTWLYDIASRKLAPMRNGDSLPLYFRGLIDLPTDRQKRAAEAMQMIPQDAVYSYYPESEERI